MPYLIFAEWPNLRSEDYPKMSKHFNTVEPDGLWFRAVGDQDNTLYVLEVWSDIVSFRRFRDEVMARDEVQDFLIKSTGEITDSHLRTHVSAAYPGTEAEYERSTWIAPLEPATIAVFIWPDIKIVQYQSVMEGKRGVLRDPGAKDILFAADGPYGANGWVVAHIWRKETSRLAYKEHAKSWNKAYIGDGPLLKKIIPLQLFYYTKSCPTKLINPLSENGIA